MFQTNEVAVATSQESDVCAFMGIGNSEQDMQQLQLDGRVSTATSFV
jgi:hypothetical protein